MAQITDKIPHGIFWELMDDAFIRATTAQEAFEVYTSDATVDELPEYMTDSEPHCELAKHQSNMICCAMMKQTVIEDDGEYVYIGIPDPGSQEHRDEDKPLPKANFVQFAPGVRVTEGNRKHLAGKLIAKYGLQAGVTEDMIAELDRAVGVPKPRESGLILRQAWHSINGYLEETRSGTTQSILRPPSTTI